MPLVTEFLQQLQAAQAENDFLRKAISLVAAIEAIGQVAVPFGVFGNVGVEQIDGDDVAVDTQHVVFPGANPDLPLFDLDRDAAVDRFEGAFGFPLLRLLGLLARGVEILAEISLAVDQRDGHQGRAQIGGGAERVAGQHAQAATVGRHVGIERDLHREVGDRGSLRSVVFI